MNCKQAQHDIALWVGHDLDDTTQQGAVRRHVTSCPDCRDHYQRMKHTLMVLERADRPATYVSGDSLWPELASRISHVGNLSSARLNPNRFTGWMPMIAMTAACFILLLVVNKQPQQPGDTTLRGPGFSAPPVMFTEGSPAILSPSSSDSEWKSFDQRNAADDLRRLRELQKLREREQRNDL